MHAPLTISAGQYSEKGAKTSNEDACGILIPDSALLTSKGITVMVADGVSSAAAGREAAESCVQGFISDYYSTPESWTIKNCGKKVLGAINRWLHGNSRDMLTTASVLILKSSTAHIFHIGDCRIHRLRDGHIKCLTKDHQNWVSKDKAFLCRAMGADSFIEIDYLSVPLEVGDIFILTSDGVHGYIDNTALYHLLSTHESRPEQAATEIAHQALRNGSEDNVTCQVLRIETLPEPDQDEAVRQLGELPFPPPLEAGQILDDYRVLRELHASQRSQIYLVEDTGNGQQVILKTPSVNQQDDPVYIDGFLHEEWVGRRINNPHVQKIIASRRRRRFLYYAAEYIEGQTLRQWMNDHPLADITEIRPIMKQMIVGIRAFHRKEMIHQDLKPENIMIDLHGTVKIIDFGSTKIGGIQEINSPIQQGTLLGTHEYAAPEYFLGLPGTTRSDLYSLGVLAYEMLTGKLPYGRPLSRRNLNKLKYIPLRQYNPEIPAWIDGAVEKAVQIKPRLRYEAKSEFLTDLFKPNMALIKQRQPLIEKNPIAFWRMLALISLISNLLLLYLLTAGRV